ncbi:MAG TPA: NADH-quinone oxidoreductase subunit C [Rhodanobacteraceae bacterium]|nr:NADH-quinone oxidoreductase subunit C [Rhodanobacteraceae bacterium]
MGAESEPTKLVANAIRHSALQSDALLELCRRFAMNGGRLVSLWASERHTGAHAQSVLSIALQDADGIHVAEVRLDSSQLEYPDLSGIFPAADRLQRAAFDLVGVRAVGGDERRWLRHAAWPADAFPLRHAAMGTPGESSDEYPFVRVAGDGVHEIPVGPVHAGIIEPGHFRFSVVGEKVLRLEERLGYVHKGIEKRFESLSLQQGVKLAARISGDSAVAFSWAYCLAVEQVTNCLPPRRAIWLRALYLERERLANHLGDLGALGNDAGFAFGLSQFSRLKESLLRANARVFGSRYLFDALVPGGVAVDLAPSNAPDLVVEMDALQTEVIALREIYDNHAGVQDRFVGAGELGPDLAARLGVIGLAGRASGQHWDLRCDLPSIPYDELAVNRVVRAQGDVAARVAVRFDEVLESVRLCKCLLAELPEGPITATLDDAAAGASGYGWVEGWRGPVFVALTAAAANCIERCHPHDPSWHNWPALEHAVIGNIVPDFPLINKSFNLSYSGHDL